ncbi:MAG: hypothetical protein NZ898_13420 [Myxococcota bacterium]|nr:hypothetical protein [Myxococcota bacterium]MDW8363771.1 hypothetical protein [Myxococcales bacterium]
MLVIGYAGVLLAVGWGCGSSHVPRPDATVLDATADIPMPTDASASDESAASDTGADGAAPACGVGSPCTRHAECASLGPGAICLAETTEVLGGPGDRIEGHEPIERRLWIGGYCTRIAPIAEGGCDPDVPDSCCEAGGARCLSVDPDARGRRQSACVQSCTPREDDNDVCRDGYACEPIVRGCVAGCSTDEECRVHREDTDGDGYVTPPRPGRPSPDRLVYDPRSTARCDRRTWRCTHDPPPGASAGDACVRDADCEVGGICLREPPWRDGYCTRVGCDAPGVRCAPGGHCQSRFVGVAVCLGDCVVADHPDPFAPHRTCRPGYRCVWDGMGGTDDSRNGGCVPGEFNDVREPNVGARCDTSAECYSPFGAGICLKQWGDVETAGTCTVIDCAAPGVPADVCGPGAACVEVDAESRLSICLALCDRADQCADGMACAALPVRGGRACVPFCRFDGECRSTERCEIGMGGDSGHCVPAGPMP